MRRSGYLVFGLSRGETAALHLSLSTSHVVSAASQRQLARGPQMMALASTVVITDCRGMVHVLAVRPSSVVHRLSSVCHERVRHPSVWLSVCQCACPCDRSFLCHKSSGKTTRNQLHLSIMTGFKGPILFHLNVRYSCKFCNSQ